MEKVRPKAKNFRDLEVWQLGMKIVTDVYEAQRHSRGKSGTVW